MCCRPLPPPPPWRGEPSPFGRRTDEPRPPPPRRPKPKTWTQRPGISAAPSRAGPTSGAATLRAPRCGRCRGSWTIRAGIRSQDCACGADASVVVEGQRCLHTLVNDITQRLHDEAVILTHAQRQRAISMLGQKALKESSVELLMNKTVAVVAETLGMDFCSILHQTSPQGPDLDVVASAAWHWGPGPGCSG